MMLHLDLLEAPPDGRVGLVAHSGAEGGVAVRAAPVHIVRSVGERLTTLTNEKTVLRYRDHISQSEASITHPRGRHSVGRGEGAEHVAAGAPITWRPMRGEC